MPAYKLYMHWLRHIGAIINTTVKLQNIVKSQLNNWLSNITQIFFLRNLNYGKGADYIADKMHTKEEKEFIYQMDNILQENEKLIPDVDNRGEGGGDDNYALFYYEKIKNLGNRTKSNFKISSQRTKLNLSLRFKNIQKCSEHIMNCSDELKSRFIPGDNGCSNRPKCSYGQKYTIDGIDYWQCGGQCKGMITFQPRKEDISDYIKLVNMAK